MMDDQQLARRTDELVELYIADPAWRGILPRLKEAYRHLGSWSEGCMEETQQHIRCDRERTETWLEDGPRNTLRALLDFIAFGGSPPKFSIRQRHDAMRNALLTIAESCTGEAVAIAKRTLAVVDSKEDEE